MNEKVPNIEHFKTQYREIVQKLVLIRKEARQTQMDMAEWIGVDRRKILHLESLKKIDLETLLKYADKLSVDVKLNFEIN